MLPFWQKRRRRRCPLGGSWQRNWDPLRVLEFKREVKEGGMRVVKNGSSPEAINPLAIAWAIFPPPRNPIRSAIILCSVVY